MSAKKNLRIRDLEDEIPVLIRKDWPRSAPRPLGRKVIDRGDEQVQQWEESLIRRGQVSSQLPAVEAVCSIPREPCISALGAGQLMEEFRTNIAVARTQLDQTRQTVAHYQTQSLSGSPLDKILSETQAKLDFFVRTLEMLKDLAAKIQTNHLQALPKLEHVLLQLALWSSKHPYEFRKCRVLECLVDILKPYVERDFQHQDLDSWSIETSEWFAPLDRIQIHWPGSHGGICTKLANQIIFPIVLHHQDLPTPRLVHNLELFGLSPENASVLRSKGHLLTE